MGENELEDSSLCILGDQCWPSNGHNFTLPHPYHAHGENSTAHDVISQVVPLEDTEHHQYPGHIHLEDNSLVYALVNRTVGFK